MAPDTIQSFIARWSAASASERGNSQLFLTELCDVLDVQHPDAHRDRGYAFEFPVPQQNRDGSITEGRIDLYKRGCFVLESKQFHAQQEPPSALELALHDAEQDLPGAMPTPASSPVSYRNRKKSGPIRGTEKWDDAMTKARGQAERYIRSLPHDEPTPPFLIVLDVGDTFEIYADFTQAGKAYLPFPDPRTFRLRLADLANDVVRAQLRTIWTDPFSLDPARKSAAVTREIAGHLAELAKSLEAAGHPAQTVAEFLTRCLFCMFAEDVELLPHRSFTELLHQIPADGTGFEDLLRTLFGEMNTGTGKSISVVLRKKLLQFNGGLFADDTVLPVNGMQLGLLRAASRLDWRSVEPAIFGTLLERALNPNERHKLGAHYTPRAYVERLVLPTVVEPIRAEWESVRAAALTHARAGRMKEAREEILRFHKKLCQVKVLDPACGSGNFLYVTLEHLKRLEGEVLDEAAKYGETFKLELEGETVDPHQFLGIEINPRAASITELVLWIGYLQWHFRTHGSRTPHEPILRNFHNIECRDAVLAHDGAEEVTWQMAIENPDLPGLPDEVRREARRRRGNESQTSTAGGEGDQSLLTSSPTNITLWDRRSFKTDLVTGRDVPDETKRVPLLTYKNPRPAEWPKTDYVVGNPPYLGARTIRPALGDGYLTILRGNHEDIPENVDYVMYWWHKAATMVRQQHLKSFGFITTNSFTQSFNRAVVEPHLSGKPPVRIGFAIPDHPWVDSSDGAAVRVAMTVGALQPPAGILQTLIEEARGDENGAHVKFAVAHGIILPNLTIGQDTGTARELKANADLCCVGYQLTGTGFTLEPAHLKDIPSKQQNGTVFRLLSARDIVQESRCCYAIDVCERSVEELRLDFPDVYQRLLTRVKPERDSNSRESVRTRWWIYGEARNTFRPALRSLKRMIVAPLTSKHRLFIFAPSQTIADSTTVMFALDDAFFLGTLSSRIHAVFSLAAGGHLGVGNDPRYNKTRCFDPFPFPDCGTAQKEKIRRIAEELDAHRKRVQAQHPGLTLTGMYNVLEKLRATQAPSGNGPALTKTPLHLTAKEKQIHDQGLVSVLKQLHDDLDAAVFEAYGWVRNGQPETNLTDAEILERIVALNAERAREEAGGLIRWLRPEYQNPGGAAGSAPELKLGSGAAKKPKTPKAKKGKSIWPKTLAERVKVVSDLLRASHSAMTPEEITRHFSRAKLEDVQAILETLVIMGQARAAKEPGRYIG